VKIDSFEDLNAWKSSRELVKEVYSLTKKRVFARDFALVDQIRRAAISIVSNISEGFERGSNREFVQFLYMAKGSCGEVRAQLAIASDQGYIEPAELAEVDDLARRTAGMLGSLINYLKTSKIKGSKFKSGEVAAHKAK
jgi:four helix bundle protein